MELNRGIFLIPSTALYRVLGQTIGQYPTLSLRFYALSFLHTIETIAHRFTDRCIQVKPSYLLTCYLGRHSHGSGCAGINGNNRVPNCRCPSSAILRPGDPNRHPVLVPPSEAVDGRSTEAGEILLHRGHPRFELAATLLAPMHWGLGVDDLADDFAGRTSRSMPESTKSTLEKHRSQSSKVELTANDGARYTI